MALKVSEKQKKLNDEREARVKRGKNAKRKGGNFERAIAKLFGDRYGIELKRTPQSGGFAKKSTLADDYRGDITIVNPKQYLKLHIECKARKTLALPQWLRQAEEDCPNNRTPITIFHIHNSSDNYVACKLEDFCSLIKPSGITLSSTIPPKTEEWRPITGFDGYFVSNMGRVKSIRPSNGKGGLNPENPTYLKAGIGNNGYEIVVLRKGDKSYTKRVHKLVAKEFLGLDSDVLINHKDGDKSHNYSTNLEESTHSKNLKHAYESNLRKSGEDIYCAKLSDLDVISIRFKLANGVSRKELSEAYGVSDVTILRIDNDLDYRNPHNLMPYFKNQKTWQLKDWIAQAEEDCPKNRTPIVIFHQHNTSKDYVCVGLEDFLKLVEKDRVIGRREIE